MHLLEREAYHCQVYILVATWAILWYLLLIVHMVCHQDQAFDGAACTRSGICRETLLAWFLSLSLSRVSLYFHRVRISAHFWKHEVNSVSPHPTGGKQHIDDWLRTPVYDCPYDNSPVYRNCDEYISSMSNSHSVHLQQWSVANSHHVYK